MATQLDRRTFLRYGGAGAAAVAFSQFLAGCGNPSEKVVKFVNWQDYIDDQLLADFTTSSGLTVSYSTYESNDELGDRLALAGVPRRGPRQTSTFDLIVPSDNLFRRLRDQSRLKELDTSIVTEALLANLAPEFRQLDFDPGNKFCVPWATGTTGIGYDTDVFSEPPTWDVFLDATHGGKMTLLDESREAFAAAMYSLGDDPNSTDPAVVTAAEAQLTKMLANSALNSIDYLDKLENGSSVAVQGFSTDILQAISRKPNLAFVIPESGGTRWIDVICIPEDAPNPDGANELIAFYLDPKVSAQNATAIKVFTGNDAAREFLPPEIADNPAVFPDAATLDRLTFIQDLDDDEQLYVDAWSRVRG